MNQKFLGFMSRKKRRAMTAAADAARDSGDLALAASLYGDLAAAFPDFFGAWVQLGNMLKDLSRYSEAEDAYARALSLKSEDGDLFVQKGHLAKLRGDPREALELYRRAERLDPTSDAAKREIAALGFAETAAADAATGRLPEHDPDLGEFAALIHRRLHVAFGARRA